MEGPTTPLIRGGGFQLCIDNTNSMLFLILIILMLHFAMLHILILCPLLFIFFTKRILLSARSFGKYMVTWHILFIWLVQAKTNQDVYIFVTLLVSTSLLLTSFTSKQMMSSETLVLFRNHSRINEWLNENFT